MNLKVERCSFPGATEQVTNPGNPKETGGNDASPKLGSKAAARTATHDILKVLHKHVPVHSRFKESQNDFLARAKEPPKPF